MAHEPKEVTAELRAKHLAAAQKLLTMLAEIDWAAAFEQVAGHLASRSLASPPLPANESRRTVPVQCVTHGRENPDCHCDDEERPILTVVAGGAPMSGRSTAPLRLLTPPHLTKRSKRKD